MDYRVLYHQRITMILVANQSDRIIDQFGIVAIAASATRVARQTFCATHCEYNVAWRVRR
jgi:hypothetical protein